ncbi:pyruvoyl-dependent arginine decarboxylase [Pseudodesulfovibrio sp.]|uniref:pyruvoyl-dependent arginine decarboxylase n=1 Tax=unclassified Pseudodesulfovibrio TaxID=2661612 RepID=UPI003B0055BC
MLRKHRFFLLILGLVLALAVPATAAERFGPRIPTAYFATTGTGQSDQGIPPDPYETFSYDLALQQAGIENFNVVYYTSVLPPEAYEIPLDSVSPYFHHGSVLETIMAKAGGMRGDTVCAGVGRVWAKDKDGKSIGGFAAEYERVYKATTMDKSSAISDARAQLTASLKHELSIRNLVQDGAMRYDITSLIIKKKYGIALAALGFVGFIYPEELPSKKK